MPFLDEYATTLANAYDYQVLTDIALACHKSDCMNLDTTTLSYVDKTQTPNKNYQVIGETLKNKLKATSSTFHGDLSYNQIYELRKSLSTVEDHNNDLSLNIYNLSQNMQPIAATYNVNEYNIMRKTRNELDNKMRELYNEEETDHQIFFDSSTYLNLGLTVAATSAVYFLVTNL